MTTRRQTFALGIAIAGAPFLNRKRHRLFGDSRTEYSERAVRLVRESLVIDALNQFLYRRDQESMLRAWLTQPGAFTATDWQRFKDTGINAISFGERAATFEE